ncbi:hypothetical protein D3C85_943380 [compost metagenome]
MVARQCAGHLDPLQLVLAVVEPLLEATVVGVQQALVMGQVRRLRRLAVGRQVGRRGAGDLLQGKQRPGHQALVHVHARTDGQVEAFGHQVAVAVVQIQLDADLPMLAGEVQQKGLEECLAQGHRHREPHATGQLLLQPAYRLPRPFGLGRQGLGFRQQRRPSGGQAQATRGAVQQRHAQALLQLADAFGQLALAATQALRRASKTAALQQHREGCQVFHIAHGGLHSIVSN